MVQHLTLMSRGAFTSPGQVPETLDNRGADALDGERTGKISGRVR